MQIWACHATSEFLNTLMKNAILYSVQEMVGAAFMIALCQEIA